MHVPANEKYFVCKCSNVSTLHLNTLPIVLQNIIQSWSKLHELIQLCNNDIDSVLKTRIFCNSSITFKNKSIVFTSFLQSNLRTITLILKVTLSSGTIVVSPFKTFMNFSEITFFYLRKL
jgi:hypothetical protein